MTVNKGFFAISYTLKKDLGILTCEFFWPNKDTKNGYHKKAESKKSHDSNKNWVTTNNIGVGSHVCKSTLFLSIDHQRRALQFLAEHYTS